MNDNGVRAVTNTSVKSDLPEGEQLFKWIFIVRMKSRNVFVILSIVIVSVTIFLSWLLLMLDPVHEYAKKYGRSADGSWFFSEQKHHKKMKLDMPGQANNTTVPQVSNLIRNVRRLDILKYFSFFVTAN